MKGSNKLIVNHAMMNHIVAHYLNQSLFRTSGYGDIPKQQVTDVSVRKDGTFEIMIRDLAPQPKAAT